VSITSVAGASPAAARKPCGVGSIRAAVDPRHVVALRREGDTSGEIFPLPATPWTIVIGTCAARDACTPRFSRNIPLDYFCGR